MNRPLDRTDLHTLWTQDSHLPASITDSPPALRYLELLGLLDWRQGPERDLQRNWGQTTIPYAPFAAACLIKLEESRLSMGDLRTFLVEHPLLIWVLGFPLTPPHQPALPAAYPPRTAQPRLNLNGAHAHPQA